MAIIFDSLPTDKPSAQSKVDPGQYSGVILKAEMATGKTSGNEYLAVTFKLDGGGFVNEGFTWNDKAFNQWKIGRLCKACGVTLAGEFQLKDLTKVIKGKQVILDVTVNDRGYATVDYSGDNEGIYPVAATAQANVDADAAIDAAVDDDDF